MCNKNNSYRILAFWLSKVTCSNCEEYMVKTFCNAPMSKSYVSFNKVLFTRGVTQFNGGKKKGYVLPKFVECYSATTSFKCVDFKREHMTFLL